jgi:hypothetical protein
MSDFEHYTTESPVLSEICQTLLPLEMKFETICPMSSNSEQPDRDPLLDQPYHVIQSTSFAVTCLATDQKTILDVRA